VARLTFSMIALAVVSLACAVQVRPPPSTATPSPVPTARATVRPSATAEAESIAIVRQPVVNVRLEPGGDPTGEYVLEGQEVVVLEIVTDDNGDEWAKIAEPAGYIFAGCLEGSEKGCVAK
jgi:hypothetical protein